MSNDDPHSWAKRAHDRHDVWYGKLNEATIQSGTAAVRYAFLLNGGACLALLAFLANTLTATGLNVGQRALLSAILPTLGIFAWGALLSVIAAGGGYLVNRCAVEGNYRYKLTYEHPYVTRTRATDIWLGISNVLTVVVILVVLGSLGLFVAGLITISRAVPYAL
jgi:hypothetical protein